MRTHSDLVYYIYTALIPIAVMLMLIGFAISLTEMAMDQQISPEKIVKKFLFLIAAMMLINTGVKQGTGEANVGWIEKLYIYTLDISEELTSTSFAAGSRDAFEDKMGDLIDELNKPDADEDDTPWWDIIGQITEAIWDMLMAVLSYVVYALLGIIVTLFVYGVGVLRAVKLGIYLSMTPIALGCYYNKTPMGLGYIKTLATLFIQQWVIILSAKIVFAMLGTASDVLGAAVLTFSLIGTVLSSERKARELLR